jgi:uncharacterized protein
MKFDDSIFKELQQRKKEEREKERLALLEETIKVIKVVSPEFKTGEVYICGSLIKSHKFHSYSDIDIAVTGLSNEFYFTYMARIQMLLPRQVEIIELERCRFADQIIKSGLKILPDDR